MDEKLNKIFDHSECPPGEVLRKYVQGELSGKELRSFEEHLASCEMCSDEVEGMAFINNPEKIEADVTFLKQQIDSKLATDAAPKTIPMYLKIAAAVLFLFAVSFIVYVIINNNSLSEKSLLSVNTNSDRIIHKEALSEEKKPVAQEEESLAKEGEKLSQLQENKCKDKKPKATIIDAVTEDSEKESLSDADNNFDKKMSKQDTDNRRENLGYGVSAGSGKAAVTKSEEKIFSTADASPIMKTEASKPDKDEASKKQTMAQKDKPVTNEQINSDGVLLAEEKSALESESTISNETKSRKESGEKSRNEPDEKKKEKKVSREKSTYNNEEQKRASGESYAKKKADNKNAEMPASASTISQDADRKSTRLNSSH